MDDKELCILIGCSGMNKDCPGNPNCEMLKKIKEDNKERICQAHMAGQNNANGCDASWSEAYGYYTTLLNKE